MKKRGEKGKKSAFKKVKLEKNLDLGSLKWVGSSGLEQRDKIIFHPNYLRLGLKSYVLYVLISGMRIWSLAKFGSRALYIEPWEMLRILLKRVC